MTRKDILTENKAYTVNEIRSLYPVSVLEYCGVTLAEAAASFLNFFETDRFVNDAWLVDIDNEDAEGIIFDSIARWNGVDPLGFNAKANAEALEARKNSDGSYVPECYNKKLRTF